MKLLRLSLCAALALSLVSGCSSSSTTGGTTTQTSGPRSEKSADDEAKKLIAKLGTLSDKEKQEQGPQIAAQILTLRNQVSEQTRKEIDWLLSIAETRSETDAISRTTASDSATPTTANRAPRRAEAADSQPPERAPAAVTTTRPDPELAPQPREMK